MSHLLTLLLSAQVVETCSTQQQAGANVLRLRPGDCTNHTEWSEEDSTCVCSWGWTGEVCDTWERDECFYPEYRDNYEGSLNITIDGSHCIYWLDEDVGQYDRDLVPGTDQWITGFLGDHNYCRNPDDDPNGFWCYTRDRDKSGIKPRYCKIEKCKLEGRSFLFSGNSTSDPTGDKSQALNIIYGPVLPGVCGGVVALMTIVGFGEFLRRRRIFQKLRRRLDPEAGAPRRLGGVVTVDVDTGLQPETGQTMQLVDDNEMQFGSGSEGNENERNEQHVTSKSSLSKLPELSALPEEEEEQEALSDKDLDFTDTCLETTQPLNTGSDSSSDSDDDDLGTSASVQEEKREFEAGLSDLRHKLAQDVIIEEEEDTESDPIPERPLPSDAEQPQFGMLKFRRSGKSSNINSDDPDNPLHMEISSKEIKPNGQQIPNGHSKPQQVEECANRINTLEQEEKFPPMSIGSARSSSRNSFVMNTISRFETQSIASIKGEDMDSIIDGIHQTKISDFEPKDNGKSRTRRKDRRSSIDSPRMTNLNDESDRRERKLREHDRKDKTEDKDDERRREERRKRREKEKRRRERREDEREVSRESVTKDDPKRRDRDRTRHGDGRDRGDGRERRRRKK